MAWQNGASRKIVGSNAGAVKGYFLTKLPEKQTCTIKLKWNFCII